MRLRRYNETAGNLWNIDLECFQNQRRLLDWNSTETSCMVCSGTSSQATQHIQHGRIAGKPEMANSTCCSSRTPYLTWCSSRTPYLTWCSSRTPYLTWCSSRTPYLTMNDVTHQRLSKDMWQRATTPTKVHSKTIPWPVFRLTRLQRTCLFPRTVGDRTQKNMLFSPRRVTLKGLRDELRRTSFFWRTVRNLELSSMDKFFSPEKQ